MDTTGHEMGLSLMAQRVDWLRGMVVFGQCSPSQPRVSAHDVQLTTNEWYLGDRVQQA